MAAALWQHPHILILDELADYVELEDMEALRCAIDRFGGGVILVTENAPRFVTIGDILRKTLGKISESATPKSPWISNDAAFIQ